MAMPDGEFADIQGLVWSGYGPLKEACFILLCVTNAGAARTWLARTIDSVTTIAQLRRQRVSRALHVALTAEGMRALDVPPDVVEGFSAEFVAGMAGDEARSRRLGDIDRSAPSGWRWGSAHEPHLLLMLYAEQNLADWRAQIEAGLGSGFVVLDTLSTSDMDGTEPFGFLDGISQPRIDWSGERAPNTVADLEYGNLLTVGEFVLGYRNEYGLYTDRPLLDPAQRSAAQLPVAENDPSRRDLGRNGSYLVMRELSQDVRGFWRFVAAQSRGDPEALAQAMVGRQMSGDSLLPMRAQPIRGVDEARNRFTYDDDADGLRCPFGAHVRRANPRTGDVPGGRQGVVRRLIRALGLGHQELSQDLIAASRFHRIIRRGREFGDQLKWQDALRADVPDPQSGLHFICLSGNISRQFEFIQNAWLNSAKFDGMSGEADPLLGNRQPMPAGHTTDGFRLPQANGVARWIDGLPNFVRVRGGAYFFLPGVRALRYFAGG
jgi:deferrochelatase/peroxidase EfeB